jgi:hypothetical protein
VLLKYVGGPKEISRRLVVEGWREGINCRGYEDGLWTREASEIGVCIDLNNDYLDVIKQDYSESVSVVDQYLANWDSKKIAITSSLHYHEGFASLADCDVDQYRNLYFADTVARSAGSA